MAVNLDDLTIGEAKRLVALIGDYAATKDTAPMSTPGAAKPRGVVVTTATRDVIYGEAVGDAVGGEIILTNARRVYYWSAATGGLGGLAVRGPADGSKIGQVEPRVKASNVVTVADCTDDAVAAFARAGWAK